MGGGLLTPTPMGVGILFLMGKQTEALRFVSCPSSLSQETADPGLPSSLPGAQA